MRCSIAAAIHLTHTRQIIRLGLYSNVFGKWRNQCVKIQS